MSKSLWQGLVVAVVGGLVVYWLTKSSCSCKTSGTDSVA